MFLPKNSKILFLKVSFIASILWAGSHAQLSQADSDSGWVQLFNGKNLDGFYTYFEQHGIVDITKQDAFFVENGIIHVPKAHSGGYTNLEGHLITKKQYSWYKVRVDYKFSTALNSQNAGLVIHIDNDAAFSGNMKALRPRSIEINMRRAEESQWTFWAATNLGPYISTTVKPGTSNYLSRKDGGVDYIADPWGNRVVRSTYPNSEKPMGQWNHGEAVVYGDSMVTCTLNGQLRVQGWNIRLRGSPNDPDPAKRIPCDKGGIGVQSEGQEIWYKNFEIMELEPHTLRPINAKTTALAAPVAQKRKIATVESPQLFTLDGKKYKMVNKSPSFQTKVTILR
jgi:hypothetical protein